MLLCLRPEIREGLSRLQQNDKNVLESLKSKNEALQNLLYRAADLLTSSQRENGQQVGWQPSHIFVSVFWSWL